MPLRIGVIADFNVDNFVRILNKHCAALDAVITAAPYGQVLQTLLNPSLEFWAQSYDALVVWTLPGTVVGSFNDVIDFQPRLTEDLDREVDAFINLVRSLGNRAHSVFLPSWVSAPGSTHRPSIEMRSGVGTSAALLRMNFRLVEGVGADSRVVPFNADRWVRHAGGDGFSDKLWHLSKTPFSSTVFDIAARDMVATLRGLKGQSKKIVIVDLDDTLWGGIVGDLGWAAIKVGGHDPVGEAFSQFQRELKRLSREGIVLAIVSKNEEAVAIEALDTHPDMVLRSSDFAGWRINWNDKAQNIVELLAELNLGIDAAVFIDDSGFERTRVQQALPQILVPDWPGDPLEYSKALRELRCFENPVLSREDRSRTAMYVSDRQRDQLRCQLTSMDEWLETLDLAMEVEPLSRENVERAAQLLNKTNQMNLATRRMSSQELMEWGERGTHRVWTFRVVDRIGDYGVCGVASVEFRDSRAELIDFVLSCRAMGRGIEEAIISTVANEVCRAGAHTLVASYVPTEKNKPCLRWLEQYTPFDLSEGTFTFTLNVNPGISAPRYVRITMRESVTA